jgi:hypothetical protein
MQFDGSGSFQSKIVENAFKKETTMTLVSGFSVQASPASKVHRLNNRGQRV